MSLIPREYYRVGCEIHAETRRQALMRALLGRTFTHPLLTPVRFTKGER